MSAPAISVLLPVRDAAATLPACLRSIARQSEPDFECVIVDDGSQDGSLALARRVARADARFRVLARPPEGLVESLNAGLAACRGRYLARVAFGPGDAERPPDFETEMPFTGSSSTLASSKRS